MAMQGTAYQFGRRSEGTSHAERKVRLCANTMCMLLVSNDAAIYRDKRYSHFLACVHIGAEAFTRYAQNK